MVPALLRRSSPLQDCRGRDRRHAPRVRRQIRTHRILHHSIRRLRFPAGMLLGGRQIPSNEEQFPPPVKKLPVAPALPACGQAARSRQTPQRRARAALTLKRILQERPDDARSPAARIPGALARMFLRLLQAQLHHQPVRLRCSADRRWERRDRSDRTLTTLPVQIFPGRRNCQSQPRLGRLRSVRRFGT